MVRVTYIKWEAQGSQSFLCSCTFLGAIIFSIFHLLIEMVRFGCGHRGSERLHAPAQSSKVLGIKMDFIFHLPLVSVCVVALQRR